MTWLPIDDAFTLEIGRSRKMDLLHVVQSFIEKCERPASSAELAAAFQNSVTAMGFRYFACCTHVDPRNPPPRAVVLLNYPAEWVLAFSARQLYSCDPVFLYAESTIVPFSWDDAEFRATLTDAQREILREAATLGLEHGFTAPIHLPWLTGPGRASCSVVPDSPPIDPLAYLAVQIMAIYLYSYLGFREEIQAARHMALDRRSILTARERQCLELAAHGKTDWTIGRLLRISEHTVHKHIEAAKRRLGVATRVQAIVSAAQLQEICIDEITTPQRGSD